MNATKNYYLFGLEDSRITRLVKLLYQDANINFIYSKTKLEKNVTAYQIGYLLGKWYNYYFNMPLIQSLIDKYESGNKDLTEEEVNILNAIKNNYNREENEKVEIKKFQNEAIINKYKKNPHLKDFCNMELVAQKIRSDKYKPKIKNNIDELKLKHIKKYKKTIIDNSKKLDKTISGEYFRQQFNKIFNYKTFDFIKNNIIKAEVEINKNSALSDYAKMVKTNHHLQN